MLAIFIIANSTALLNTKISLVISSLVATAMKDA